MQNKVRITTAAASSPASATARAAGTVPSTRLGLWSPILAPISGLDKGLHAIRTCMTAGKTSTVSL
jgi:hypothetical protein